mmetsp:Transcript_70213/g.186576  ORF Transcript_70213/g.186576 Transcript_70213/m.186576 type:complete len:96 (+) Transcript_70213:508-795(+)
MLALAGVPHAVGDGQRFAGVTRPDGVAVGVPHATECTELSDDPRRSLLGASGQIIVRQVVVATLLGVHTEPVGEFRGIMPAIGSNGMAIPATGEP